MKNRWGTESQCMIIDNYKYLGHLLGDMYFECNEHCTPF